MTCSTRNKATLKITIDETPEAATMKLEGRVVGPWVRELEAAWNILSQVLGPRKLAIDLCGVTYIDITGRELLADIYRQTAAELFSNTPLMSYFAEQAKRHTHKEDAEGEQK